MALESWYGFNTDYCVTKGHSAKEYHCHRVYLKSLNYQGDTTKENASKDLLCILWPIKFHQLFALTRTLLSSREWWALWPDSTKVSQPQGEGKKATWQRINSSVHRSTFDFIQQHHNDLGVCYKCWSESDLSKGRRKELSSSHERSLLKCAQTKCVVCYLCTNSCLRVLRESPSQNLKILILFPPKYSYHIMTCTCVAA